MAMSHTMIVLSSIAGGVIGGFFGGIAVHDKPQQNVYKPVTTVIQPATGTSKNAARLVAETWPGLDQKEIEALTQAVDALDKTVPVNIFCADDFKCGELSLDFDNALESAHFKTEQEKPLVDKTIGITTSSAELQSAINRATNDRLSVELIPKNAPYYALVIGRKPTSDSETKANGQPHQ